MGQHQEHIENSQLVKQVLQGNNDTFKHVISLNQRLVTSLINRFVQIPEVKEDLVQEIFIKVYQGLKTFSYKSKLSTWIGIITYNHCVNYKQKIRYTYLQEKLENADDQYLYTASLLRTVDQSPAEIVQKKMVNAILHKQITQLPPLYQTIVTLYHFESQKYETIAAMTNLPIGTVKSYLFRARKILKENLAKNYTKEELSK